MQRRKKGKRKGEIYISHGPCLRELPITAWQVCDDAGRLEGALMTSQLCDNNQVLLPLSAFSYLATGQDRKAQILRASKP